MFHIYPRHGQSVVVFTADVDGFAVAAHLLPCPARFAEVTFPRLRQGAVIIVLVHLGLFLIFLTAVNTAERGGKAKESGFESETVSTGLFLQIPNYLFTQHIKNPLFNGAGVNTDRTSHS